MTEQTYIVSVRRWNLDKGDWYWDTLYHGTMTEEHINKTRESLTGMGYTFSIGEVENY